MPIDMNAIAQMARDSGPRTTRMAKKHPEDPRDVLTVWEREHLVPDSARLHIPIRDTIEIKAHMLLVMRMAERIIAVCDAAVDGRIPERTAQITAGTEIRSLATQLRKNPTLKRQMP